MFKEGGLTAVIMASKEKEKKWSLTCTRVQ